MDINSSGSMIDEKRRYWYQDLTDEERERDILFLLGLPGSGKSTALQVLRDRDMLSQILGIPAKRCPRFRFVKVVYARDRRRNARGQWTEARADGHFLGPEQFSLFLDRSTDQQGPLILIHHSLVPEVLTVAEAQQRFHSNEKEQQHYRAFYLKDLIFALLANDTARPTDRREIPCVVGPLNMFRAIGWLFPRKKAVYLDVEYGQLVRQLSIRGQGPVDELTYNRLGEQYKEDRRFFLENDPLTRMVIRIKSDFVRQNPADPSRPPVDPNVLSTIATLYGTTPGKPSA